MEPNVYHVLNGDSLRSQFPNEIVGEIIVARECLIEGDVFSENLSEFYHLRSQFISTEFGDFSPTDYYKITVSEFEKINSIPDGSIIHCWFEDDLFCQVNWWFVCSLIQNFTRNCSIYLVRPKQFTWYGFGGLNKEELIQIYQEKKEIKELTEIAALWNFYQKGDLENLKMKSNQLASRYSFIKTAVQAHIERIPTEDNPGRPIQSLKNIMKEFQTKDFGLIFREFSRRESIYGFGDTQVKRMVDEIIRLEE